MAGRASAAERCDLEPTQALRRRPATRPAKPIRAAAPGAGITEPEMMMLSRPLLPVWAVEPSNEIRMYADAAPLSPEMPLNVAAPQVVPEKLVH